MKVSIKVNKIILYSSIITASLALLILAVNIFYFNSSVKEDINVGLIGVYITCLLIMLSQHFEIKHKNKIHLEEK